MPLFTVTTNVKATEQLSKALGKPAQMMAFGGSQDSCAMCFLYSIGKIGDKENKDYSKLLCDLLNKRLKIPVDRTYICYFEVSAASVGWNSTTFA
uniref:Macrophage migration inhibitory factor n=1 Tax=Crocodylus porosus TaxID=8502 RepID=A0A7M4DZT3_CROPO